MLGGELALYLAVKVLRGDLTYYFPLYGFSGAVVTLIYHVTTKVRSAGGNNGCVFLLTLNAGLLRRS